jgi:hypothetical protein
MAKKLLQKSKICQCLKWNAFSVKEVALTKIRKFLKQKLRTKSMLSVKYVKIKSLPILDASIKIKAKEVNLIKTHTIGTVQIAMLRYWKTALICNVLAQIA